MENENRESRLTPIGSLTSKIVPMPSKGASAQARSQRSETSSSITGFPRPGLRPIGPQPGGSVSINSLSSLQGALVALDADQVRRTVEASLAPSWSLRPLTDSEWGLAGFTAARSLTQEERMKIGQLAESLLTPTPAQQVRREAAKCLTVTASREREGMDIKIMLEVFADELSEFPPDVVGMAFREWARREKWWPTLSEIRNTCLREVKWRKSLKKLAEGA